MKRGITISLLAVIMGSLSLAQSGGDITIAGPFKDISFSMFAKQLSSRHNIYIYYRDEWVEDIVVDLPGDTILLFHALNDILNPHGIKYFDRGNGQIYLTGERDIVKTSMGQITPPEEKPEREPAADSRITENVSYEKRAKRHIVGRGGERDASGAAIITGHVRSVTSGEPVIGATVVESGTSNGTISSSDGFYALNVSSGRDITLDISCLGMEKETYFVTVNSSGTLNIEMTEKLIDIQEVVVRTGKHDNVRGIQMGFQRLAVKEIKSIPVVMGERDLLKVANMMPGVQTVGEGSAGFNVRGSSSDQNLFLLNEIPVYNTGHLFGFFSAFNPDMISDFNLYKSNFPVEYGGRLASVFEFSTRKGNKKKFGARGAISPVTGSLLFEVPVVKDKVSVIAGVRSSYSDWILNRLDDRELRESNASFNDLMTGIHIMPDSRSSLQIFGYMSNDRFNLAGNSNYRYSTRGASILYDRQLSDGWKINIAAVHSRYINFQDNLTYVSQAYEHEFSLSHDEVKARLTGFKYADHTIVAGGNFILHNLNQGTLIPASTWSSVAERDFGKEKGAEYALFISDEYRISDKLTLYTGLRYSFFDYLGPNEVYSYAPAMPMEVDNIIDTTYYGNGKRIVNYNGPEYRLSLNRELAPNLSLKISLNRMRQYLFMLSNTVALSPTDRWKMVDSHTRPPVADQVSIGIYKNINSRALETSAEIYYKNTHNVVEYKDGAELTSNPLIETAILQGRQNSYGAEFLVRRNAGRLTGWISYTWSRSLITVDSEYQWGQINRGMAYAANYDKPHALNLVGSYKVSRRLSLASNLIYNSGRPITYPTGLFYLDGIEVVNYSYRNEFRIPDYFRVDVSLSIEGNLIKRKFAHGSWMFAVYNATGRRNAYSIYFKNEQGVIKGYKQSIYGVPIFTVSYNIKLGNYAVE
ncbi:MAG: TonB-dependent receptor [Bacteroidales bacterium]|nr:TonB-dependent receptor [Bacteroidales bacterium]